MSTYREAVAFKLRLSLTGQLPRTLEFADGPGAEREAARLLAAYPDRTGLPWAHLEYVDADGLHSTYARLNSTEWHSVHLFGPDPDSPTGQRYTCSCGARRHTVGEMDTHQANAGRCVFCWGAEEVHPLGGDGVAVSAARDECPACEDGAARPGVESDRSRWAPTSAVLRARPLSEDHSF